MDCGGQQRIVPRAEAPKSDRMALLMGEAGFRKRVHGAGSLGRVLVLVISHLVALVAVGRHRRARRDIRFGVARARRARDIGDRGDVIPVESVPEAERGHS